MRVQWISSSCSSMLYTLWTAIVWQECSGSTSAAAHTPSNVCSAFTRGMCAVRDTL